MDLIIAEKQNLGTVISKAIGIKDRKDGYNICNNNTIVTWGAGHLFELKDVDDYLGEKKPWKDVKLPFSPEKFEYKFRFRNGKEDEQAKKQFKIIQDICEKQGINRIIHCGDADREGQIIVDIILDKLNWKKEVKRLWLPEQTDETIRCQLKKLEDNSKYINFSNEGYARSYMDWLLGINLSRYVTLQSGIKMNVGRVMIPIIKFIYDRDKAIKNFVKSKYYQAESVTEKDGVKISLTKDEKYRTEADCNEFINTLPKKAIVSKIEKKEIKKTPKKLFSLTKLQEELSSKHKINFNTSMKVIQNLYEKGFITYPRTSSQFLAEEETDKVQKIINLLKDVPLKLNTSKRIFDNSKIESHSAITITTKLPGTEELDNLEKIVYETVKNRFISNFLDEETIVEKTTIFIKAGNEEFKLSGQVIRKEGFLKYEPEKIENKLPILSENEEISTDFKAVEKETQPPKNVTESELGNYLENPFRTEKTTEDEAYKAILEGVEIGTVATRTETIEKCKKEGYISQKGAMYSLEPFGEKLIDILDTLKINLYKEKTVEFSEMQKKIYKGSVKISDLLDLILYELENIVNSGIKIEKIAQETKKEVIGICPRCGRNIYENEKSFYCEGYKSEENKCTFSIWKEQKYPATKINKTNAKALLAGKNIHLKNLKSKEGKEYEADFKLKDDGKYVNLEIVPRETKKEVIGICPRCGRNIYESEKSFYCEGYKDELDKCTFSIWKEQKYLFIKLTKTDVRDLLIGKDILVKNLYSKSGKKYDAYFKLEDDGKYVNLKMTEFADTKKK